MLWLACRPPLLCKSPAPRLALPGLQATRSSHPCFRRQEPSPTRPHACEAPPTSCVLLLAAVPQAAASHSNAAAPAWRRLELLPSRPVRRSPGTPTLLGVQLQHQVPHALNARSPQLGQAAPELLRVAHLMFGKWPFPGQVHSEASLSLPMRVRHLVELPRAAALSAQLGPAPDERESATLPAAVMPFCVPPKPARPRSGAALGCSPAGRTAASVPATAHPPSHGAAVAPRAAVGVLEVGASQTVRPPPRLQGGHGSPPPHDAVIAPLQLPAGSS
mmetsp:Transcript_101559/g.254655  ORF Transcript_101559/g.254655 Transcript_101559/m.254655 type:complete len:275 (-) Transcript_101559:635-1459(-)